MQPLREMVRQFSALIPLWPREVFHHSWLWLRCVKKMNHVAVRKIRYSQTCIKRASIFGHLPKSRKWSPLITVNLPRAQLSCHLYEEFAVTFSVGPKSYFLLSFPLLQRSLWQDVLVANRNTVHLCMALSSSPLLPSFLLAQEEEESDTLRFDWGQFVVV